MDKKELKKYMKKINGTTGEIKKKNFLKSIINKLMVCIVLFLSLAIVCKTNDKFNNFITKNLFNANFSFTKIKNIYNKYLGGIFPLEDTSLKTKQVFNEKMIYTNISKYKDGAMLEVSSNYLVPALKSGLVLFIGEKENYGNVIIIQGEDGIDIWYGNINGSAVNLYDYVEEGSYIGEVIDKKLYLVYSQDGKFLNYEDYFN